MSVKLGSDGALVRLGAATYPSKAYLGDTLVSPTVPGAPTINYATYSDSPPATSVGFSAPADNGGSAITGYKFYFDGVEQTPDVITSAATFSNDDYTDSVIEVSAVNAVGEGPKSEPDIVTPA